LKSAMIHKNISMGTRVFSKFEYCNCNIFPQEHQVQLEFQRQTHNSHGDSCCIIPRPEYILPTNRKPAVSVLYDFYHFFYQNIYIIYTVLQKLKRKINHNLSPRMKSRGEKEKMTFPPSNFFQYILSHPVTSVADPGSGACLFDPWIRDG
jgi:hypothetical protein